MPELVFSTPINPGPDFTGEIPRWGCGAQPETLEFVITDCSGGDKTDIEVRKRRIRDVRGRMLIKVDRNTHCRLVTSRVSLSARKWAVQKSKWLKNESIKQSIRVVRSLAKKCGQ